MAVESELPEVFVARQYDLSAVFIDSMPRYLLGSLTADRDMLISKNALIAYPRSAGSSEDMVPELRLAHTFAFNEFYNSLGSHTEALLWDIRIEQEIAMWRLFSGIDIPIVPLEEWGALLYFITENPAALLFAESGIDNIEFITKCLNHGIDPSSATDLYQSTR